MTWTKISDDFGDDTWSLSDRAFRLHVEGLVWANRKLTDCRIDRDDLRQFKAADALPELLDKGYWTETTGDAFVIRHHAKYQRKREKVIAQQEANRANGAKRGKSKQDNSREIWPKSTSHAQQHQSAEQFAKQTAERNYERTNIVNFSNSLSNSLPSQNSTWVNTNNLHSDSLNDSQSKRDGSGYKEEVVTTDSERFPDWDSIPDPPETPVQNLPGDAMSEPPLKGFRRSA